MRLLCSLAIASAFCTLPCFAETPSLADALRAAKSGDRRAQYIAGTMYMLGDGTKQNLAEAARWLHLSAQGGLPQAMVALGNLYDVGQGVPLDTARAADLRQQAARAGNATARGMIEDDRKMPGQADFRRANILYDLKRYDASIPYAKRAAAAGSANAQYLLGRANHWGLGVPVNLPEAVRLYRSATDRGLDDAARHLAYMYEFGLGVPVNRKTALMYYDRSAAAGNKLARQAAANLRSPEYDAPVNYGMGASPVPTPIHNCPPGSSWNGAGRCRDSSSGNTDYGRVVP